MCVFVCVCVSKKRAEGMMARNSLSLSQKKKKVETMVLNSECACMCVRACVSKKRWRGQWLGIGRSHFN